MRTRLRSRSSHPLKLDEIRSLLAAPPSGDYYEVIE
jgi:hypothetical protein